MIRVPVEWILDLKLPSGDSPKSPHILLASAGHFSDTFHLQPWTGASSAFTRDGIA